VTRSRVALRILMYHAIGEPSEPATRFVLPVRSFERQMRLLGALRFNVVRLEDAARALQAGAELPRRAVALTFDDGTQDTRRLALPILERHEYPATAFVVTGAMGGTVDWTEHAGLAGRRIMTWAEALELEPLVTLQAHTRTHPSLRDLPQPALSDELSGSRRDVEERTGHESRVFAYPYGHYDEAVAGAVAGAGFSAACTVKPGTNQRGTPAYELRRQEVRGDASLRTFLRLLTLKV
jgi:peptidoglycan/xylan/chitin deacetylase (PgdA/CDA1 family)